MPHTQRLSSNPCSEPDRSTSHIHTNFFYIHSTITLQLRPGPRPIGLFPVGLSVKIFKPLLLSHILATCSAYLNITDVITLAFRQGTNYEAHHCDTSSLPLSHSLCPYIFLRNLFSNTFSLYYP